MSFNFNHKGGAKKTSSSGFSFGGGVGAPDPLADVEYTNDLAKDAASEMSALEEGFKSRAQKERDRFQKATDSEFWFAVCFTSREEKEAFLKAAKVNKKFMGDKYIDGRKLAQILGIEM